MRTKLLTTLLVGALALGNTGCIKKIILNGTIASTRIGAGASDTIGDYELARNASSAAMLQFEGMHRLAPDNEDALYLLMRGWAGYGYAFPMDDMEAALIKGDEDEAEYHKKRAKLALDRAIAYGLELAEKSKGVEGFKEAGKSADTMKAWLKKNFEDKEDAEILFWIGGAWMARVSIMKDDPELVAQLFVGVAMLERSRELNPEFMSYSATATLGAYHARSPSAELDEAKKLLDEALAKTGGKALGVHVNYARYACAKGDQALYEKMVNEVINVEDPEPTLRLTNTVAKRRAKRMLKKAAMEDCGFQSPEPAKKPEPPKAEPAKPAAPPAKPADPPKPADAAKPAAPPKPADPAKPAEAPKK